MIVKEVVSNPQNIASEDQELIETQPQEQSEDTYTIDLTSEELVDLVGNLVAFLRCRNQPESVRQQFVESYKRTTLVALKLIGFDSALQKMPIKALKKEYVVALGFAIMLGVAFLIPVPKVTEGYKAEMNMPHTEQVRPSPEPTQTTEPPKTEEVRSAVDTLKAMVSQEAKEGEDDIHSNG